MEIFKKELLHKQLMQKLDIFYDAATGELIYQDINCVIINRRDQAFIQQEVESILGPVTKTLIYEGSKSSNRAVFQGLLESLKMEKLKKLEWVLNRLTLLGYGLFSLENIEERNLQIEISVKNCFNADGYQTSKKPICYAMAGTLAGTMESIFKREMSCTEISCKATGKPVCSFKLTAGKPLPPKGFGASVYLPPRKLQNGKTIEKYELLYDETVGELIFEKTRSVVVVRGQRARYLREFENIIGPSARSIIYNISKNAAIEAVSNVKKSIIKIIGLFAKKPIVVELLKQLPRRGFGVPTIIDFDSKKPFIKIRVKNCYGTEGFYESTEPVCYALAGIFSGGAEVIFNREMACIETKCAAMGEKYCEFEISGGSRAFME